MIIYIIGFGRSGSTALSQVLEKKLAAVNLGEVKYLYRNDKNDLLDPFWLSFKKDNLNLVDGMAKKLKRYDNFWGLFKWDKLEAYRDFWDKIFKRLEIDPERDIIIDSSKTTLDSFMRGFNLQKCYQDVLFIKPKRNAFDVLGSMLKGKNSNIERENKKSTFGRAIHILFVGLPHLLITLILSWFYRGANLQVISLKDMETEVEDFIKKYNLKKCEFTKNIPMVYGNRSRKEDKF